MRRRQQPEAQMTRGEEMKTGGRYVGTSRGNVKWVCYGNDQEFNEMCELFDKSYAK